MAISISCSNCGRVVYASEKEVGKSKPCPGCGYSLPVPADPSLHTEKPTTKDCPQCGNRLRLVRQFHGKNVRCNKCGVVLSVSADPWQLSVVGGELTSTQLPKPSRLPTRMPSIPDGHPPAQPPSDSLAFLSSESPDASPSPQFPAGMPLIPQTSEESDPPKTPTDLLARYRRTSKAKGAEIKEKLTRAVGAAKKRSLALKLGHEAKSLQTAIEAQLETLGTLMLTHRPATVDIGPQIAELSQIQDELSRKQATLESLRDTKGSGSVVKEVNQEMSKLHSRQKNVMVAIGQRVLATRPEMPGSAGPYAALDRLESSLEAKQKELKIIEDEIGPVWLTGGMSFGAMKRPLVIVTAMAGGLLLLCLLWKLFAATLSITGLLGSGYEVEYKQSSRYYDGFEITVRGKAAKLAVMLTDPQGETWTEIIEDNKMITNSATVILPIAHPPGTYILSVKTFVPEGVVFRKEFKWPPENKEAPRIKPKPPAQEKPAINMSKNIFNEVWICSDTVLKVPQKNYINKI